MEAIFHEKQEGSLCAQHCLNALLQGPYFTPVDLGSLAQKMDDEERLRMAECGEESEEYQRFLQQPSGNMDDSGYFSVQVIASALEVWGLELVPYSSTERRARDAHNTPYKMQAFICNYKDHWFTVRRLGNQWFNLNSLLSKPELISDTYLSLFLAQLQQEGYSIFIVCGSFPDCEADQLLKAQPATAGPRAPGTGAGGSSTPGADTQEQLELRRALELSMVQSTSAAARPPTATATVAATTADDDNELQKALRLSLQGFSEENSDDDEAQLRRALEMSLECRSNTPSAPSTPVDQEELRVKRIAFLERMNLKDQGSSKLDGL